MKTTLSRTTPYPDVRATSIVTAGGIQAASALQVNGAEFAAALPTVLQPNLTAVDPLSAGALHGLTAATATYPSTALQLAHPGTALALARPAATASYAQLLSAANISSTLSGIPTAINPFTAASLNAAAAGVTPQPAAAIPALATANPTAASVVAGQHSAAAAVSSVVNTNNGGTASDPASITSIANSNNATTQNVSQACSYLVYAPINRYATAGENLYTQFHT